MADKFNLFLIGAMKSGSTTLHDYLSLHPEIFMSPEKEPGYFVDQIWGSRPSSDYESLAARSGNVPWCGESSTHYTKSPLFDCPANRIHDYNPDARLIYIMRNPIDRAISHYLHWARDLTSSGERKDILEALKANRNYVQFSDYEYQLRPYLRIFDRRQILLLVLEEFAGNRQKYLGAIADWLEIAPFPDKLPIVESNKKPEQMNQPAGFGVLNYLRHSALWQQLNRLFPKSIKEFAARKSMRTIESAIDADTLSQARSILADELREPLQRLQAISENDFAIWQMDV